MVMLQMPLKGLALCLNNNIQLFGPDSIACVVCVCCRNLPTYYGMISWSLKLYILKLVPLDPCPSPTARPLSSSWMCCIPEQRCRAIETLDHPSARASRGAGSVVACMRYADQPTTTTYAMCRCAKHGACVTALEGREEESGEGGGGRGTWCTAAATPQWGVALKVAHWMAMSPQAAAVGWAARMGQTWLSNTAC